MKQYFLEAQSVVRYTFKTLGQLTSELLDWAVFFTMGSSTWEGHIARQKYRSNRAGRLTSSGSKVLPEHY
jgi:hypothetical protein